MNHELYELRDHETGQLRQYEHVFALGNVVTGKGNIKASLEHGRQVSEHVLEEFLAWREEDYQRLLSFATQRTEKRIQKITEVLEEKNLLSVEDVRSLIEKVEACQRRVGYQGNYSDWIEAHQPETIADVIAAKGDGKHLIQKK